MADLLLSGQLNLSGTLKLSGDKILVNNVEALVEVKKDDASKAQGNAPAPVPIPPPPAPPSDPGVQVWIIKSFNSTVTANGVNIVAMGMCVQGSPSMAKWPGMVMPSSVNSGVSINFIKINVVGDKGTILPTGAPVPFTSSGQ